MHRRDQLGRPRRAVVLALVLALAVSLCGAGCQRHTETPLPPGAHETKILVVKGRHGETLALAPVYINGKGPYAFAVDTGASRSVVDRRIAAELGLPVAGDDVRVSGVGGTATARPVRVERWSVAEVDLPTSTLDSLDLTRGDGSGELQGLLGSDTLSKFEVISVDYKGGG